jgi:hypothetical protein
MKLMAVIDQPKPDAMNVVLRANLKGVTRWSSPVTVYCSAVGSAVAVTHDLGAVPNAIAVEPLIDARWWVDQDDRSVWNATTILFRSSAVGRFIVRAGFQ